MSKSTADNDLTSGRVRVVLRMIGITLVALAGNMFSVSTRGSDESVVFSGRVILVSVFALGGLTLLLPVPPTWFATA